MNTNDPKTVEADFEVVGEAVPTNALEAITRGEIDIQIQTAHKFPRSLTLFKKRAIEMATIDEETAASCLYRKPVGKKDGVMQYAEGLSVRMAEIVMACFGNIRVAVMLIDDGNQRHVRARGMAHDLESNSAASSEVIEATTYKPKPGQKQGDPYSDAMRVTIAKAALAKARRDAVFIVVPKALARPIEAAVRALLKGDEKSLTRRRSIVMKWIVGLGIDQARVWAALGIKGEADLGFDELETLSGLKTAIADKDSTVDEAFPVLTQEGNVGKPPTTTTEPTTTATEAAASEGGKTAKGKPAADNDPPDPSTTAPKQPEKKETPPAPKGPSADALRKKIVSAITAKNIGKSRLMTELKGMNVVPADADWAKLDAATLVNIDDLLEGIIEKIQTP